jgi:predicted lipoprotein with Yx(FWY)xxD motif
MKFRHASGFCSLLSFIVATPALAAGDQAQIATPPGITLQFLGKAQGYSMDAESASFLERDHIAYADIRGMTLYTRNADPPGKSECYGECTQTWKPSLVPTGAKPIDRWSIVKRADGTRQWALNGKPLYTYVKDIDIGDFAGNSPKWLARGPQSGARGSFRGKRPPVLPVPEGWAEALAFPVTGISLPPEFTIKEVPDALGIVLMNHEGRTLYTFSGKLKQEGVLCHSSDSCNDWQPLEAPEIAKPLGDFAFVVREDGFKQWTYKGKPLYTFATDLPASNYADGVGIDPHWQAAYVLRYYMPKAVRVVESMRLGKTLATDAGQTLYIRDGWIVQSGGGHGTRRGDSFRPAVGRDIGINTLCEHECEKWHPYLAPNNTLPQGYWSTIARPDGKSQWVYNGYALWTYDGDKKPGDINGQDLFDTFISDNAHKVLDIGTQYDGPTALYWAITPP